MMQSQRGNIIAYTLIGLVLFGGMLSGAWWVKNRGQASLATPGTTQKAAPKTNEPAKTTETDTKIARDEGGSTRSPQPTAPQTQAPAATTPAPEKKEEPKKEETKPAAGGNQSTQAADSSRPAPSTGPATTESSSTQGSTGVQGAQSSSAAYQTTQVAATGPSTVAASGPTEDALMSVVAFGSLALAGASYARSYRAALKR